jgi:3-deoxy-manno-octulosonate cytidylyltransferase (CMP-KDO synthetase)
MDVGPVCVVIPARYASSRFPGKPLALIHGISLLERTYRQVGLCGSVDFCVIATDDPRIAAHAKGFGADVVITSSDCPTGTDRIAEAVAKRPDLQEASLIVNVQGDEPCIDPTTISAVITVLQKSPDASIGTIVSPIRSDQELRNPNIVKCVKTPSGKALYFSRHAIPGSKSGISTSHIPYYRHIGMYAYRPAFVVQYAKLPPTPLQQAEDLEMLRAMEHGFSIAVAEVSHHSPDVNIPSDIQEVEKWIQSQSFCS